MTRTEAAQICQSIKFILENSDYTEAVEEALNMAIAALKQLSLPKIIIRQGEQEPSAQPFTAEQIQTMQELEAAQIEKAYELGKADRPTGYWIDTQVDSVGIAHRCICSICGEEPAAWSSINKFDFCPNCGADMRGGNTK